MMNLRRKGMGVPQLNTASLPDLIFTVLFFFMVVTHMRTVTLKVKYQVPQGKELTRLTKKTAVSYIYIGQPQNANSGEVCIQLNDKIATPADIEDYVIAERGRMQAEDRTRQTVSLKADRNVPMGTITEVKKALRRVGVQRISYSAEEAKAINKRN